MAGKVCLGELRQGRLWQVLAGVEWSGVFSRGELRCGIAGKARLGRFVKVGRGMVVSGTVWQARRGLTRQGETRQGRVRYVVARQCNRKEFDMKALYCKVGEMPNIVDVSDELDELQTLVSGWIEVLPIEDEVVVICNEEGKINGMLPNRMVFNKFGDVLDIIYGDFILVNAPTDSDGFEGLTDDQIVKYEQMYRHPLDA